MFRIRFKRKRLTKAALRKLGKWATVALIVGQGFTLSPCEYEDSPNCVWVASDYGNQRGNSFVAVGTNQVVYVPHWAARIMAGK